MIVNPYFETRRNGGEGTDPMPRLLTRLLHELAHSSSVAHDAEFYDAQRFFLLVATEELGWELEVNCRVCCHAT